MEKLGAKKSLINGTIINTTSTVIVSIIQVVLISILISELGPYEYGLIGIINIFSLNGYISLFDIGMPSTVQRYVAKFRLNESTRDLRNLVSTTFSFMLIIGLFLFLVVYNFANELTTLFTNVDLAYRYKLLYALQVFSLTYIIQFPSLILQNTLIGFLEFFKVKLIVVALELTKLIGVIILMEIRSDFIDVVYLYSILHLVQFIFLILIVVSNLGYFNIFYISFESLRKIRAYSGFQFAGKTLSIIYNQSDRLLIGIFLNPATMGAYDVIMKIPSLINKFLGLSMSAIVPVIGGVHIDSKRNEIKDLYEKGFKLYAFFIVPLIVFIFINAQEILFFWVGQKFQYLSDVLRLLMVWSYLSVFAFGSSILTGLNEGMMELTLYRIGQTFLKIIALLLLLTSTDIWAVPLSFIISMIPGVYLQNVYRKIIKFDFKYNMFSLFRITLVSIVGVTLIRYFYSFLVDKYLLKFVFVFAFSMLAIWYFIFHQMFDKNEKNLIFNIFLKFKKG